jgi:uncharacterized protein YceK
MEQLVCVFYLYCILSSGCGAVAGKRYSRQTGYVDIIEETVTGHQDYQFGLVHKMAGSCKACYTESSSQIHL